jgi:hypothetical protein
VLCLSFTSVIVHLCRGTRILSIKWSFPSNGSRRTNCNSLTLQLLRTKKVFQLHFKSSHGNELSSSLHFTSLHFTSLHFTSLHFTSLICHFQPRTNFRTANSLLQLTCVHWLVLVLNWTVFGLTYKCWSLRCGRTQRRVLLHVTSRRSRDPSLLLRDPLFTS